jgi:murein DD-endopeptidase MepM/ murein hydrolase activator NlpD
MPQAKVPPVPAGPSISSRLNSLRLRSRIAMLACIALVAAVGVLAMSGVMSGVTATTSRQPTSPSAPRPLTDDTTALAAPSQPADAQLARVDAWYRAAAALDNSRRRADQQRASRGEPRQALSGPEAARYWRPTTGTLTQTFHPGHDGIDIGVPLGTPVLAAADGVVTFAGEESGYGTHLEVRHADGTITTYSHLSKIDVVVGQAVRAGQQIAESGNTGHSTGPHLHFEVHPTPDTLTDPLAWLKAHGAW